MDQKVLKSAIETLVTALYKAADDVSTNIGRSVGKDWYTENFDGLKRRAKELVQETLIEMAEEEKPKRKEREIAHQVIVSVNSDIYPHRHKVEALVRSLIQDTGIGEVFTKDMRHPFAEDSWAIAIRIQLPQGEAA